MLDKPLNETEAAEALGLAPSTLRRWRVIGYGPTYLKVGRVVRYELSVIKDFIESNTMSSTSARLRK